MSGVEARSMIMVTNQNFATAIFKNADSRTQYKMKITEQWQCMTKPQWSAEETNCLLALWSLTKVQNKSAGVLRTGSSWLWHQHKTGTCFALMEMRHVNIGNGSIAPFWFTSPIIKILLHMFCLAYILQALTESWLHSLLPRGWVQPHVMARKHLVELAASQVHGWVRAVTWKKN